MSQSTEEALSRGDLIPEIGVTRLAARKQVVPRIDLSTRSDRIPTLFRRIAAWVFPWCWHSYPGHLRGLCHVLGRPVPYSTLYLWKKSDRPPVWAAVVFRDHIRSRCATGLALADELDAYIKKRESEP
jgi:hypothetical protein